MLRTYPIIRIWVAGCSTGEEAYSLAIVLQEANIYHKSLIYATDINKEALKKAEAGILPLSKLKIYEDNYQQSNGLNKLSEYYSLNGGNALIHANLKKILFLRSIIW